MFQKCPICEGSGEVPSNLLDTTCSVCKGEKIISTLTGLPPNRVQQFPSAIDPSVIGPHTSPNNNWGLPTNTFAPAPTVYIRNPTDDKNLY